MAGIKIWGEVEVEDFLSSAIIDDDEGGIPFPLVEDGGSAANAAGCGTAVAIMAMMPMLGLGV